MKEEVRFEVLKRMRYLKGHLEGVSKMIADDKYCIDVIKQNDAVIAALKKANQIILDGHLRGCVLSPTRTKDKSRTAEMVEELIDLYEAKHG